MNSSGVTVVALTSTTVDEGRAKGASLNSFGLRATCFDVALQAQQRLGKNVIDGAGHLVETAIHITADGIGKSNPCSFAGIFKIPGHVAINAHQAERPQPSRQA